jgi:hypothetical protein
MTQQMLEQAITVWGRGQLVIFLFHYLHISSLCIAYFMGPCITEPIGRKGFVYIDKENMKV